MPDVTKDDLYEMTRTVLDAADNWLDYLEENGREDEIDQIETAVSVLRHKLIADKPDSVKLANLTGDDLKAAIAWGPEPATDSVKLPEPAADYYRELAQTLRQRASDILNASDYMIEVQDWFDHELDPFIRRHLPDPATRPEGRMEQLQQIVEPGVTSSTATDVLPLPLNPSELRGHLSTHHDTESYSNDWDELQAVHAEYHNNALLHGWTTPNAHRHTGDAPDEPATDSVKLPDYIWRDPQGNGWIDAWNGWYETLDEALDDAKRGVSTPRILTHGQGLIAEDATATCKHCGRSISYVNGAWVDPEATGDDAVWRETCDSHDTVGAEHEPATDSVNHRRTGPWRLPPTSNPEEVPAGLYMERYVDHMWGGPYESIAAVIKSFQLTEYPGWGCIWEWDGETAGSVPSLNPDDLYTVYVKNGHVNVTVEPGGTVTQGDARFAQFPTVDEACAYLESVGWHRKEHDV